MNHDHTADATTSVAVPSAADDARSNGSGGLPSPEDVRGAAEVLGRLCDGLNTAILGQTELVDQVVVCLLARGHLLLEGLPGLGKTQLVKSLAALLRLQFRRIQFTPDLLPGDIVGTPVLEEQGGQRRLVFHRGPVFTNLLLADEINRATPKTQSALLEAMSEGRVTSLGESHALPFPFFVLATQNPIELEGTYPLPEAQLDRFMMKINVEGVSAGTLQQIISTRHHGRPPDLSTVVNAAEWTHVLDQVDRVHLPAAVANYIARLVEATHPAEGRVDGVEARRNPGDSSQRGFPAVQPRPPVVEEVQKFVRYGASPRAAIALAETSRARALLRGRPNVGFGDVQAVAPAVLNHRLLLDYSARMDGWSPRRIVSLLLEKVPELARDVPEDVKA
jgi:MoxR-like ATPase